MLFKKVDDKSNQIQKLEELLLKTTAANKKDVIIKDLNKLNQKIKSENEIAYYLDFDLKKNKNIILLHDVDLSHNGRSAHIDHILITRLGVELINSFTSAGIVTISDGGSTTVFADNQTNSLPNPLEEIVRASRVFKDLVKSSGIFSMRISLLGGIKVEHKIIVDTTTVLSSHKLPKGFERSDCFISKRNIEIDKMSIVNIFKATSTIYSIEKAYDLAQFLKQSHSPKEFTYTPDFKEVAASKNTTGLSSARAKPTANQKSNHSNSSYVSKFSKPSSNSKSPKPCPRCGQGTLVERKPKTIKAKEKYGDKGFLGCSRYPKCRYKE